MKKYIIIGIIFIVIITGVVVTLMYNRTPIVEEPIISIDGVDFTLNEIKDKFLESDYASSNNCSGLVNDEGISLTCNENDYEFIFNGYELTITTDAKGLEIYKYIVNEVAQLQGYAKDEYLESIEKFINGEAVINGLRYNLVDNLYTLEVDVVDKLEKVNEKEVIEREEIRDIDDVNYEYQNLGYTIYYMELTKDDYENLIVFYGVVLGSDNYDIDFTIKYYDDSNNLLTSETVNLKDFETFNNPYLGFSVVSRFIDENIFNAITKYSISLSE